MNPLFQQLGQQQPNNMMQQLQNFMRTFQGDPKAAVQQMLNSGRVSQQQYNQAVQIANQLTGGGSRGR